MTQSLPIQSPRTDDPSFDLAQAIAQAADDRKASDIVILQVNEVAYLADYFVIATGLTSVQLRAIARAIEETIEAKFGRQPQGLEGLSEGRWILIDYGDVIAHLFLPQERDFYNLEAFWGHASSIPFRPQSQPLLS
jgi:ribosome-associated protein